MNVPDSFKCSDVQCTTYIVDMVVTLIGSCILFFVVFFDTVIFVLDTVIDFVFINSVCSVIDDPYLDRYGIVEFIS